MVEPAFQEKVIGILEAIEAKLAIRDLNNAWVRKETMMRLTGLASKSINNYVNQKKIVKRGTLYSYRSYLEYLEIYKR